MARIGRIPTRLDGWFVVGRPLRIGMRDGTMTSPVVSVDGRVVTTESGSRYELGYLHPHVQGISLIFERYRYSDEASAFEELLRSEELLSACAEATTGSGARGLYGAEQHEFVRASHPKGLHDGTVEEGIPSAWFYNGNHKYIPGDESGWGHEALEALDRGDVGALTTVFQAAPYNNARINAIVQSFPTVTWNFTYAGAHLTGRGGHFGYGLDRTTASGTILDMALARHPSRKDLHRALFDLGAVRSLPNIAEMWKERERRRE